MSDPTPIRDWMQGLPLGWLVSNIVGSQDAAAQCTVYDQQVSLLKQAVKAAFPLEAPTDALDNIGGDRSLIQGPSQSDADFRTRLLTAWDDWARAGQTVELLTQLYWQGYTNAIIVQQNGLGFYLTGAPTVGQDPTSLLGSFNLSTLNVAMHSSIDLTRSIPAGTPWWTFDSNTDMCSRFAIILPTVPAIWQRTAKAVFNGSTDTVSVTWSQPFASVDYLHAEGVIVTDGSGPVAVSVINRTATGATVIASSAFAGEVDLLGWNIGANPFSDHTLSQVAILKSIVHAWRRGTSTCVAFATLVNNATGKMFGYPLRTFGSMVGTFGSFNGQVDYIDTTGW